MKHPFNARAPSFDADAINATIQQALASAGIDTKVGPMYGVTETIRRALGGRTWPTPSRATTVNRSLMSRHALFLPATAQRRDGNTSPLFENHNNRPAVLRHMNSLTMQAVGRTRSTSRRGIARRLVR